MDREVEILAGGKPVPLNRFVTDVVRNIVLGLVQSLRDVDVAEEIVVKVGKQGKGGK